MPHPSPPSDPAVPAEAEVVSALRAAGCVFAEDEARLLLAQSRTPAELGRLVRRRVLGEPLEQVLGWAAFDGLRIVVEPGVFVPRRRTELLVREATEVVRAARRPAVVVDLCCGSGAVAAAVAARLGERPGVDLHAADVDEAAVRCARRNLAGAAEVHQGDLLDALPGRLRGRVAVLAASPPYVPTDAVPLMPPEAREHEPLGVLDGGPDGLDVVRRIAAGAGLWVRGDGHVLLDLGAAQAAAAAEILARKGLDVRIVQDDDLGATVVAGHLRPAGPAG
jgi:release factor glutamine methyltransferase